MDELLKILRENALETPDAIAQMLDCTPDEVKQKIADYEARGILRGYQAIVNEDRLDLPYVTAVIEVKVTPEREGGFNQVAHRIARFPEVKSMHLVSGDFDLLLFVENTSLRDVASFVSERLSTIEGVLATATHFMLKTYKQHGVLMESHDEFERLKVSP